MSSRGVQPKGSGSGHGSAGQATHSAAVGAVAHISVDVRSANGAPGGDSTGRPGGMGLRLPSDVQLGFGKLSVASSREAHDTDNVSDVGTEVGSSYSARSVDVHAGGGGKKTAAAGGSGHSMTATVNEYSEGEQQLVVGKKPAANAGANRSMAAPFASPSLSSQFQGQGAGGPRGQFALPPQTFFGPQVDSAGFGNPSWSASGAAAELTKPSAPTQLQLADGNAPAFTSSNRSLLERPLVVASGRDSNKSTAAELVGASSMVYNSMVYTGSDRASAQADGSPARAGRSQVATGKDDTTQKEWGDDAPAGGGGAAASYKDTTTSSSNQSAFPTSMQSSSNPSSFYVRAHGPGSNHSSFVRESGTGSRPSDIMPLTGPLVMTVSGLSKHTSEGADRGFAEERQAPTGIQKVRSRSDSEEGSEDEDDPAFGSGGNGFTFSLPNFAIGSPAPAPAFVLATPGAGPSGPGPSGGTGMLRGPGLGLGLNLGIQPGSINPGASMLKAPGLGLAGALGVGIDLSGGAFSGPGIDPNDAGQLSPLDADGAESARYFSPRDSTRSVSPANPYTRGGPGGPRFNLAGLGSMEPISKAEDFDDEKDFAEREALRKAARAGGPAGMGGRATTKSEWDDDETPGTGRGGGATARSMATGRSKGLPAISEEGTPATSSGAGSGSGSMGGSTGAARSLAGADAGSDGRRSTRKKDKSSSSSLRAKTRRKQKAGLKVEDGAVKMEGFTVSDKGLTGGVTGVSGTAGLSESGPRAQDAVSMRAQTFKDTCIRLSVVGGGASGLVYKVVHAPTLTILAAKMIPLVDTSKTHAVNKELKALVGNKAVGGGTGAGKKDAPVPAPAGTVAMKAMHTMVRATTVVHSTPGMPAGLTRGFTRALTRGGSFQELTAAAAEAATAEENRMNWLGDSLFPSAPCPFLVAFYDAFFDPEQRNLVFVTEYMDAGSLQDIIDQGVLQAQADREQQLEDEGDDGLDHHPSEVEVQHVDEEGYALPSAGAAKSETTLLTVTWCCLKGLHHLHQQRMIHRDIKPGNILLNSRGEVKIADFGILRELDEDEEEAHSHVGTQAYMSPERIEGGKPYGTNSDIWSLGLTILALALGRYPVPGQGTYWELLDAVSKPIPLPRPIHKVKPGSGQTGFSDVFLDLMTCMLELDPKKRLSAEKLLLHKAFEPYTIKFKRRFEDGYLERLDGRQGAVHMPEIPMSKMSTQQKMELANFTRKVQEYRYRAAVREGLKTLSPVPLQKLTHVSRQTGWPVSILQQAFQISSDSHNLRLEAMRDEIAANYEALQLRITNKDVLRAPGWQGTIGHAVGSVLGGQWAGSAVQADDDPNVTLLTLERTG